MVFHIAVCSADMALHSVLQRLCMEFFSRRADSCIVEHIQSCAELLERDEADARYELYLLELSSADPAKALAAAGTLRSRGRRAPLAFLARTAAHAYSAYKVNAMQYFLLPLREDDFFAMMERAVEPEYGPILAVTTSGGLRVLTYAEIEYLECTHHIIHFHLASGEDVSSLSLRVPFSKAAAPLLEDGRFFQPHRSYIVNLACARQLSTGELDMRSGARVPIPRSREGAMRAAFKTWLEANGGVCAAGEV